jgi:Cu/Ag efflux protein CusF
MDVRSVVAIVFVWVDLSFTTSSVLGADAGSATSVKGRTPPAEEHHHPENWRFTLPKGDPVKGRAVFVKYECYNCHEVRGEDFPEPFEESAPELSQMAPSHPIEFFAESIINPNAVVPKIYQRPNGTSPMRDFTDRMTLQELIDVSSYVASLKPPAPAKLVKGVGKIIALAPQSSEIVIDHGAIKDYMDAMTMGYKVSSVSLFKGLTAGDQVEFTLDTTKRVITKIQKHQN